RDWSSDVCSSDLPGPRDARLPPHRPVAQAVPGGEGARAGPYRAGTSGLAGGVAIVLDPADRTRQATPASGARAPGVQCHGERALRGFGSCRRPQPPSALYILSLPLWGHALL